MSANRFSNRSSVSRSPSRSQSSGSLRHVMYAAVADRLVFMYAVLAIIVAVVAILMARRDYPRVHRWAQTPAWLKNPVILGALVVVALLMTACATAHAAARAGSAWRILIPVLFLGVAVLFLIFTYLTYRTHNFVAAFAVAIVSLILTLIHLYGVSLHSTRMGAVAACIPWVLLNSVFVYLLWYMADSSSECDSHATTVFELP